MWPKIQKETLPHGGQKRRRRQAAWGSCIPRSWKAAGRRSRSARHRFPAGLKVPLPLLAYPRQAKISRCQDCLDPSRQWQQEGSGTPLAWVGRRAQPMEGSCQAVTMQAGRPCDYFPSN